MSYPILRYGCENCKDVTVSLWPLSRCPQCGAFVTLLEEIVIFVRCYRNNCKDNFIARGNGKTASCRLGPSYAANRLAKKIFGSRPFILKDTLTQYAYIATEEIAK